MKGGGVSGAPCLQRALAESEDIIRTVELGKVAELLLDDDTKRNLGAPGKSPYAYAYGWITQAVAAHIGGYCNCHLAIDDTASRIRPASGARS